MNAQARVTICAGCREGAGARLAEAVRGAGVAGVEVRLVPCLMACGRPLALAVEGEGRGAYLFGGVDPVGAATDLPAFLRLFLDAPAGEIADARPAGALRLRLLARVPA